jgi:hypothetical protein
VGGGKYQSRLGGINGTHIRRYTQKKKVMTAGAEIKLPLKSQDITVKIS